MRIRRSVFSMMSLATVVFWAATSVFGQGGTGKMPMPMPAPPIQRMPPSPPRLPPSRRGDPSPMRKSPRTDVYVVSGTASGSLSTSDRLPEAIGRFRRSKLDTNVPDSSTQEYGAVEVMRAEYGGDISIFLSRFRDSVTANATMQVYARKAGSSSTVSRKQIKNRSGQTLGELLILKESGRGNNVLLLATSGNYLYRINGSSSDEVERVFKSLPLQ